MGVEGARGARALPIFCNHFEELQTVLFEVELIINNAPLMYVHPNTIETCYTPNMELLQFHAPNYLLLGRQLLYYIILTQNQM